MRGSILKEFGWTYDYLLWGIAWINVRLMIEDQAKIEDLDDSKKDSENTEVRKLETKEDIMNYINGKL